jgi:hypothetical protein
MQGMGKTFPAVRSEAVIDAISQHGAFFFFFFIPWAMEQQCRKTHNVITR